MPQLSYGVGSERSPVLRMSEGAIAAHLLPASRRFWTLTEGQQRMFTHVMVGANDLAASKKFYDAVLGAIGRHRTIKTDILFMTPVLPTAARASRSRPAGAKGPWANSILPTCAIRPTTKSARYIAAECTAAGRQVGESCGGPL